MADRDVIFVEDQTSACHREHICLHEIAHVLCGHGGSGTAVPRYLQRLFPDIAPEVVAAVMARTGYGTEEEQEAEMMATALAEMTVSEPVRTDLAHPHAQVLGELDRALRS